MEYFLENEQATEQFAKFIATHINKGILIYLRGNVGAGKTTFVRAFLHALGYKGLVKSPTYTLVEPYAIQTVTITPLIVYHFDLYRLKNPEELEWMGVRDYFSGEAIVLVEWPELGTGYIPKPHLDITLSIQDEGRKAIVQDNRKNHLGLT